MSGRVGREQRFTRDRACPVCGGSDSAPRGRGRRCHGFRSTDGRYAHCSREDYAGELALEPESSTYAHKLDGDCRCRRRHDAGDTSSPVAPEAGPLRGGPSAGRIAATYDYRDERGDLLFQVVRYEPKAFRQRRPNTSGGWIHSLGDTWRVLYRLPALLAADPSTTVYVVEGEKDAEALAALGLVATTNPGGAGKWQPAFNDALRGRRVVVLPDNDEPGRQHAQHVVDQVSGVAASVRLLALPDLPDKGDVSDWLAAGGTRAALEALAADAGTAAESSERRRHRFTLLTSDEILQLAPPEPLVGEVLTAGCLIVIYGPPKAGKSFLVLDLACSIATATPWLGRDVRPGVVVYVCAEGVRTMQVRLRAWQEAHGMEPGARLLWLPEAVQLLERGDVEAFMNVLRQLPEQPALVVFDTLARCMVGGDENAAQDMGMAVAAADRIKAEFGATGLLVHHTGKSGELERGSSSLRGAADAMLAVEKDGDRVTLTSAAQKDAADFAPIVLRLRPWLVPEGRTTCILEPADGAAGGPLTGTARAALTALAEVFDADGATFTEWLRNAKVPETSLRRAVKDVLGPRGFIDPSSPPKARGGKYRVTATGREALYGITATQPGGDSGPEDQGLFAHRHSPPHDRHGGDRQSPPPPHTPLGGGGRGGDGDSGGGGGEPEPGPGRFEQGPTAPTGPCPLCRTVAWWWQPSSKRWVCGICHPPIEAAQGGVRHGR